MIAERPDFEATAHDTVAVVHHTPDFDLVVVTTSLEVSGAHGLTEVTETLRVAPDADGIYRLILNVPEEHVVKDSSWVVTVLLPADARYSGDEDDVEVLPRKETGRPALTWHGTQDPGIPVIWDYLGR